MIGAKIRLTEEEDVRLLPAIEHSAGESFRDLPELAWIADADDMSVEIHLKYVLKGTSWVAETDSLLVGFLCAEAVAQDLHVWEMAVRREWQGKGIGRQLMMAAIEHGRSRRYKSVTLTTFRGVPWNEPFYHSRGFEIIIAEELDAHLEEILRAEIHEGFPGSLRCAMRLMLASIPARIDRK
jgi:GNAT superfamily N-acetyltransferase